MTVYTRTINGEPVEVHSGDLDGWEAFTRTDDLLGLDIETTATAEKGGPGMFGPDFRVRTVQFGNHSTAYVLDMGNPAERRAAADLLADPGKRFVSHSNTDVIGTWVEFGIALGQRAVDTMVLALLLEPGEQAAHGLKPLSDRYIDEGLTRAQSHLHRYFASIIPPGSGIVRGSKRMIAHGFTDADVYAEPFAVYAGLDAIYCRRLWDILLEECSAFPTLVAVETWLAAQTTGVTIRGLLLDTGRINEALKIVDEEVLGARKRLETLMGFPALSPRRIGWLEDRDVEFAFLTEKGNPSLDKDALPDLLNRYPDGEVATMLADTATLSQRSNLRSNLHGFIDAADPAGRVHPIFNTLRARTCRMSIKSPAMQTLKKSDPLMRGAFLFDPGFTGLSCDFKAVELRVVAALAQERHMIDAIIEGVDLHDTTASLIFGRGFSSPQRKTAKIANFLTVYGGGAGALSTQAHIEEEFAASVIQRFRRAYPGITKLGYRLSDESEAVITDYGRRIPVDPHRPYANLNYLVQSTARDLMVEAVYRFVVEHGWADALYLLVHDELVVQVPTGEVEAAKADLLDAMTLTY